MAQKRKHSVKSAFNPAPKTSHVAPRNSPVPLARGYSLIELMVVVVIAGIISSLAIPSYQSSMDRAAKHETMSYLLSLQLSQEHYWLSNGVYADISLLPAPNIDGVLLSELSEPEASYEIAATLSFLEEDNPCRILTITPVRSLPEGCWF